VCSSFSMQLYAVKEDRSLCESLMRLVAVADEASENVGAPITDEAEADDYFLAAASAFLENAGTLCQEIDWTRIRVLPREHTSQNGLTERSLSLYLSLADSSEVNPRWLSTPLIQRDSFNLLIIPWPREVVAKQFRDVTGVSPSQLPTGFGFFTYDLPDTDGPKWRRPRGNSIIWWRFYRATVSLVCGVGREATDGRRGTNEVRFSFPPLLEVIQKKHHPWKLDRSQVIQYGLGGRLDPSREWWEYADIADRQFHFISISADLVLSVLICEDLARPDPVASLVRAVGPNLLIALLMDGPQITERWGARYATVFADDPGCSVLTLTTLGMSELSRPRGGPSRSRVIAIWKDAFSGAAEIELPPGSDAVALSLSIRYKEEYTADGRGDDAAGAFPTLSGVHPIKAPRAEKQS
jgi:hypothetical protein